MKRLVIVGNGASSLLNKNGNFINNSDIVIRIKSFIIDDYEEYIGNKTTIWCTKWFSYDNNNFKQNLHNTKIWLPFIDPKYKILNKTIENINNLIFLNNFKDKIPDMHIHDSFISKIGIDNIEFIKENELELIYNNLKLTYELIHTKSGINVYQPTTYLLAILLSLERFKDYNIYISGCDGFTKGYYWDTKEIIKHSKRWPHKYEKENLYIKKLIYTNKIYML